MTLQVGIGKIPDAVVGVIGSAGFKDLGVQTELYSDGFMFLQEKGIITNKMKKINTGYSTTSLIMGSKKLYDYVHMRSQVQMRPCMYTNSAEKVRDCAPFLAVNTAIGVDLSGITLTASAYDGVVIVTEYGIADLRDLPTGFKGLALASISHPNYRDMLMKTFYNDPMMTKPKGFSLDKIPPGVILYNGKTTV